MKPIIFQTLILLLFSTSADAESPQLHYYTYKDRFGVTQPISSELPPEYMKSRGYFHVMSITPQKRISYSPQMNKTIRQIAHSKKTDEWLIQAIILSQQGIPVSIANRDGSLTISNTIERIGRRYTDGGLPNNLPGALVVVAQRMESDVNNTLNRYGPMLFKHEIESTGHNILKKLHVDTHVPVSGNLPQDLLIAAKILERRINEIQYSMNDIMKNLPKTSQQTQKKQQTEKEKR